MGVSIYFLPQKKDVRWVLTWIWPLHTPSLPLSPGHFHQYQATPEICQIRKLNRQLYVKPPTPPPVQPPKPKVACLEWGNLCGRWL